MMMSTPPQTMLTAPSVNAMTTTPTSNVQTQSTVQVHDRGCFSEMPYATTTDMRNLTFKRSFALQASGSNHTFETCRDFVVTQFGGPPWIGNGHTFAIQNGKCFVKGKNDIYNDMPITCPAQQTDGVNHVYTIKGNVFSS